MAVVGVTASNPQYHDHQQPHTLKEDAIQRLVKARRRIELADRWCRNYLALTNAGFPIGANSDWASQHCAIGSVYADKDDLDADDSPAEVMALTALEEASLSVADIAADEHALGEERCQCVSGVPITNLNDCPNWGHRFVLMAFEIAELELRDTA